MKSICVFCGSSSGYHPIYEKSARQFGKFMAEQQLTLVYGGGSVGLMGVLANAVMEHNGHVIGVIPQFLYDKEVGLDSISELIIVDSMHERKQKMAELANSFVALPGGIGTMEELFEIFTWSQLALVQKPVALYNVHRFYAKLLSFLNNMVSEGFIKQSDLDTLIVSESAHELLAKLMAYKYTEASKWIDRT